MQTKSDGVQVILDGQSRLLGLDSRRPPPSSGFSVLEGLARAVDRDLTSPDLAQATERAYAYDWADFSTFCARHGLEPLPAVPQTLALYLKSLEIRRSQSLARRAALLDGSGPPGLALSTLRRRLAAIRLLEAASWMSTDLPLWIAGQSVACTSLIASGPPP